MGLKSFTDVFLSEDLIRVAKRNEFAIEEDHLVEQIPDRLQVVVRHDKQVACIREAANCAGKEILRGFIQT